jgi:DNA-binding transcriptional ArsR family regulator
MDNNLHYMRTEAPLLAAIFRSDGQARLLAELILTGDELSLTDLAARIDLAYATVHREAERLLGAGILQERQIGRSRLMSANPDSPLVDPLRQILLVSAGPTTLLRTALEPITGISSALLYGSFAARLQGEPGPPPSDVDVMIIGMPDVDEIHAACDTVQDQVGRPINPTILTPEEAAASSGFLTHVRASPTVLLLGDLPW